MLNYNFSGESVEKQKEVSVLKGEFEDEKLNEAKKEGMKIGYQSGEMHGILEGIEEGQYREKMNVAYRMMLKGETDEKILEYTDVTREEVEEFME